MTSIINFVLEYAIRVVKENKKGREFDWIVLMKIIYWEMAWTKYYKENNGFILVVPVEMYVEAKQLHVIS
jgi:hypothetical protein